MYMYIFYVFMYMYTHICVFVYVYMCMCTYIHIIIYFLISGLTFTVFCISPTVRLHCFLTLSSCHILTFLSIRGHLAYSQSSLYAG